MRFTSMRDVNLDLFQFDYDLTWMAFFLDADERILGRFGGRLPGDADKYRDLDALAHALRAALQRHHEGPAGEKPAGRLPRTMERWPSTNKLGAKACAHCHHVYDHRREWLESYNLWDRDEVWVYPLPENVGWTLDAGQGNRIEKVAPGSAAARAGLKAGDILVEVDSKRVASFADVQHALHRAPALGEISVKWQRGRQLIAGQLALAKDWRHTDVSWRRSLQGVEPASGLRGEDLTAEEKQQLGLLPRALAFRQGNFPTAQARQAGIQQNDVIIGIDGKAPEMTMKQFDAWVRLSYRKGDTVEVQVLRGGKRLALRMKLAG
jgi:hypothetical protein